MPLQQYVSILLYTFTHYAAYSLHSYIIYWQNCKLEYITCMLLVFSCMEYCKSKAEELDTEHIEGVCEITQLKLINTN